MRIQIPWQILLLFTGLVAAAACAAIAPLQSVPPTGVTVQASDGVTVRAEQRGDALVLDITSETGIGSAQVSLSEAPAERDVILRLHLKGLEELRFDYPAAKVMAAVSSSDMVVHEEAQPAGEASSQTINPGSPYWMEIGILREHAGAPATIPLPDGYIDVSVPRDFLRGDHTVFTVSWIDFYR